MSIGQDYAYMNLYLQIKAVSPSGKTEQFLINDTLIDPMGNWLITGGGPTYKVDIPLFEGKEDFLAEEGAYKISLLQYMRAEKTL